MPYLGTYLTVLTMLDTALADTVEVSARLSRRRNALLRMARVFGANEGRFPLFREDLLTLRSTDG